MLTELQYRTFDQMLDAAASDLRTYTLEGMLDPQNFIKVAMKINYELGLKVNPSRGKIVELHRGQARLPHDFHVLNFALVCGGKTASLHDAPTSTSYTQGLLEGMQLAQQAGMTQTLDQFTTQVDIHPGSNTIRHTLGTVHLLLQALSSTGNTLSFQLFIPNENEIVIYSESEVTLADVTVNLVGTGEGELIQQADVKPRAELALDAQGNAFLRYQQMHRREEYRVLTPLKIEKSKSVSGDCFNLLHRGQLTGVLRNGFLQTNFEDGVVYLNYQSLMEDDEGNLLVLDHPLVNDYYEYAIKERLLENLILAGEQVQHQYALVAPKLKMARNAAIGFANTPDFHEIKQIWELNRKAQYHNYYRMFQSKAPRY
jgi:hypothetical protein